nr:shikimate dehydrogenase [Candidatus Omnitrophota bacterium]
MHNSAFRALKINARYVLFEKRPDEVEQFLKQLAKRGIKGLNVTFPYKEKVFTLLGKRVSPSARVIGAVNTITVAKNGSLRGYNTDCLGFAKHLKQLKVKPKKVALIGAGGAAKAVCFALATSGTPEITIYDIDRFKSLSLVKHFRHIFVNTHFLAVGQADDLALAKKDLLVNASPVGMHEQDPCLVSPDALHQGLFVYDLIYNPTETKLLTLAQARGLSCANGLGMLLHQGAEAFSIWMKPKKAPVEVMRKALEEALKQ